MQQREYLATSTPRTYHERDVLQPDCTVQTPCRLSDAMASNEWPKRARNPGREIGRKLTVVAVQAPIQQRIRSSISPKPASTEPMATNTTSTVICAGEGGISPSNSDAACFLETRLRARSPRRTSCSQFPPVGGLDHPGPGTSRPRRPAIAINDRYLQQSASAIAICCSRHRKNDAMAPIAQQ